MFDFAGNFFLMIVLWTVDMGMTPYSCITPIAQMSRKRSICVLKLVVADCCLVSVSVAIGVSLVNIRLLHLQHQITSNFYATVSYKLNASNKARLPSLNRKQSEMSPPKEVVYILIYVKSLVWNSNEHTWGWEIDERNLKITNLTYFRPKMRGNVENKNKPVNVRCRQNIRFRNLSDNNTSDGHVIISKVATLVSVSDARLCCKNKQANLKNKSKVGKLTEETRPTSFGMKIIRY